MVRPAPSTAKLFVLLAEDEAAFVAKIRGALMKGAGYPGASKLLGGVPERTLRRWAEKFDAITKGLDLPAPGRPVAKKPDDAAEPTKAVEAAPSAPKRSTTRPKAKKAAKKRRTG